MSKLVKRLVQCGLAIAAILIIIPGAAADEVSVSNHTDRLIINGALPQGYRGDAIVLDTVALQGLETKTIATSTEGVEGRRTFAGPAIETLLAAIGTDSQTIIASARDGYSLDMGRADLARYGAILATTIDGQPLSSVDKGPFWIIFPIDAMTPQEAEEQGPNSVWQLTTITLQ